MRSFSNRTLLYSLETFYHLGEIPVFGSERIFLLLDFVLFLDLMPKKSEADSETFVDLVSFPTSSIF